MGTKTNIKTVAKYMATAVFLGIGSQSVYACGSEPYLGEICTFGFNFCPQGYANADGSLLPISQNTALFSLLGTFYGGNGTTNFALPDLRGRVTVGAGTGPGLNPVTQGEVWGSQTQTLTTSQLPSHAHSFNVNTTVTTNVNASTASGTAIGPSPTSNYLGTATGTTKIYTGNHSNLVPLGGGSGTVAISGNTNTSGGGQPFSIQPPSLGITYCIAEVGIFPSRN